MSFAQKITSGLVWGQLGMTGRTVITFAISMIVARAIGVEEYGLYAALISMVELLIKSTDMGIYAVLTTYIPHLTEQNFHNLCTRLVRLTLLLRQLVMLVMAGLFLHYHTLLVVWLGVPDLGDHVVPVVLIFLVRGTMDGFLFIVIARIDMGFQAFVEIVVSMVQLAGVLWILDHGMTTGPLLLLIALVNALQLLAYGVRSSGVWLGNPDSADRGDENIPVPVSDPPTLKRVVRFGLVSWIGTLFDHLRYKGIDLLMILFFLQATDSVAHYEIAYMLATTGGLFLLTALDRIAVPLLSESYTRKGEDGLYQTWDLLTRIACYLTIPLLLFLAMHAEIVVVLLYGPEYIEAAFLITTIALFSVANMIIAGETTISLLFPLQQENHFALLSALNGILNLLAGVSLIPHFGTLGAAVATGSSALITNFLLYLHLRRRLQLRLPWAFLFRLVTLSSVMVLASQLIVGTTVITLLVTALFYGFLVTVGILLIHRFSPHEREWLTTISPVLARRVRSTGTDLPSTRNDGASPPCP
ncbi:MAG: polysaccharide biosynthesis protein [Magnetococcales bacterium]|nr:polysaccharide biosynthesis protein [Magnetococcales bacterium]